MTYVRWFNTLTMNDVPLVGGKNASLGEMIRALSDKDVTIPDGFAVTADAYWYYLKYNDLNDEIRTTIKKLNRNDIASIRRVGKKVRDLIARGSMPPDLAREIELAYEKLCAHYAQNNCDVAVRSSATAEDLPTASFAGQQETFLNIRGPKALLKACKQSMASLFTDRAIIYRVEQGFDHFQVALSVGVQKMIRADKACAGVSFSLDTETGFKEVIMIEASYGLGEAVVKGLVNPDEYMVFKPTLEKGFAPIIKKKCGDKKIKLIYSNSASHPVKKVKVSEKEQRQFCLSDAEILSLSRMVNTIDQYYSKLNKHWMPMDVEWAKDGIDGKLYILQARPETVHAQKKECMFATYSLQKKGTKKEVLITGMSVGDQIVSGPARVVTVKNMHKVQKGDIIVTTMTDPDWVPMMKKAAGIVTDLGGRTCHAAIVSRELGIPAIIGTHDGTKKIKSGAEVTLDCSQGAKGYIYKGIMPFIKKEVACETLPDSPVPIMVNLANPDAAFRVSALPVAGVGLARIEFIITNEVRVHPMALLHPQMIKDAKTRKNIADITAPYGSGPEFFVDTLAQGIGMIAAAFYPRQVIVRLSDFKTNEYYNLIGGATFETPEANPMIGFRGASRYIDERYQEAFCLECAAVQKVRDEMGLDNVLLMMPFIRTVQEAQRVIDLTAHCGLKRGKKGLKLVMMCEVPSNVILIDQFAQLFDGFSIGSNDLTQLTLGVDRDSAMLAPLFDERDPAVKKMIIMAIEGAHKAGKFIGICGQAPSDYPEFAQFLIDHQIDSISLNPDSVIPFFLRLGKKST
jgi:pyruvate,water dikinase